MSKALQVSGHIKANWHVGYTVRGKILAGENFGEFGERLAIRQNFPHQYL